MNDHNTGPQLFAMLRQETMEQCGVHKTGADEYSADLYLHFNTDSEPPHGHQLIYPTRPKNARYRNGKGPKGIFNLPALYRPAPLDAVFVVEGVKDALALTDAGCSAIALCGSAPGKLTAAISARAPENVLVMALDADERGQEANAELMEGLKAIPGLKLAEADPAALGDSKDAADAYVEARPALEAYIDAAFKRAAAAEPNPAPPPKPESKKKDKGNTAEMPEGMARHLALNADGGVMDTYDNHAAILLHDPRWAGRLTYDAMEHTGIILDFAQSPMGQEFVNPEAMPTIPGAVRIRGCDLPHIRHWITRNYELRGRAAFGDGFELACQSRAFHPIKDMLNEALRVHSKELVDLCWLEDEPELGSLEVDRLLTDYIGAAPTPFTYAVTRIHMIAAAGRIFNPGVKYDHVLVLWSPMGGIGKTTLVERLFDPWYTTFEEFSGPEMHRAMSMTWCALYEELSIKTKSDADAIKRTLSARADRVRELYKNQNENRRRQCIFWATSNHPQVLEEEAGNRRFINVECGLTPPRLDYDQTCAELDAKRELIWAQAAFLYRTYYAARAGGIELRRDWDNELKANQAAAREIPAWEQAMDIVLDTPVPPEYDKYTPVQRRCFWAWSLDYTAMDVNWKSDDRGVNRPWNTDYRKDGGRLDTSAWKTQQNINLTLLMSDLCDCPSLKGISTTKIGRWLQASGRYDKSRDRHCRFYIRRQSRSDRGDSSPPDGADITLQE